MNSPLNFLGLIELIGLNARVLQAIGGAVEEKPRPGVEKADDRTFGMAIVHRNGCESSELTMVEHR